MKGNIRIQTLFFYSINGSDKRYFKFLKNAIFHDNKNRGITEELNQVHKCIINSF